VAVLNRLSDGSRSRDRAWTVRLNPDNPETCENLRQMTGFSVKAARLLRHLYAEEHWTPWELQAMCNATAGEIDDLLHANGDYAPLCRDLVADDTVAGHMSKPHALCSFEVSALRQRWMKIRFDTTGAVVLGSLAALDRLADEYHITADVVKKAVYGLAPYNEEHKYTEAPVGGRKPAIADKGEQDDDESN